MKRDDIPLQPVPGEINPKAVVGSFSTTDEIISRDLTQRLGFKGKVLRFGVPFLDASLYGIFPNDTILLGAKTGHGKTQLATIIAEANAMAGKRVHYFALEAAENEILQRIKYSRIVKRMKETGAAGLHRMNFMQWYAGELQDVTGFFENPIDQEMKRDLSTLTVFHCISDFYAANFVEQVRSIQHETDLIILDHLHYIDSMEANENKGLKETIKAIRNVTLETNKPCIIVGQLRKPDRKNASLIPSLEDFHGSSDVIKIVTKAIVVAPAYAIQSLYSYHWPTYVSPVKCRLDGQRTKYTAVIDFDAQQAKYVDDFQLGTVVGEKFEYLSHDKIPFWARTGVRNSLEKEQGD